MTREIPLTRGAFAIVDDEDFARLNRLKWYCSASCYAVRTVHVGGKSKPVFMHKVIRPVPEGFEVDHINGNRLDNRRENLRRVSHQQNQRNKRQSKARRSSRFKGVFKSRRLGKWCAQIEVNERSIHVGVFTDERDAALAYDAAARYYFEDFAALNFPDETPAPYTPPRQKQKSSQYRGVSWSKDNRKWSAFVSVGGKKVHLGYFRDELSAARAYDRAARYQLGRARRLNFPDVEGE